ncbi:glutamate-cysteine ligase family protein, partial [Mycobacterium sp.]|uniref:glutamate-cysteine ligase family protein n=1 Tax=Mycobacterium sp. TaxID=1785 RepID=UPI003D6A3408
MAFAVASQLDQTCLADGQLAGSSDAARYLTDTCLTDAALGRVGLELEAHCFDPVEPHRRPTWDEISGVIGSLPVLPGGSVVTVEPGGAVELSGPPVTGAVPAIEAMSSDQRVLRKSFAEAGLGLVLLGTDPLRPARRINPGLRYRAMEQFFTASHTGAAGAAMMTSTASIQVNLDAGPRPRWAARVRLAHALGPTMVAIAANSPLLGAKFSGWQSTRQRVWSELDS